MERKNFLKTFALVAATGPMIIDSCKKDSATKSTTSTTGTTTTTTDSSSGCVITPTEEEGPYPYAGGEITNPLNRVDVTGGQTGVPLSITFLVVNTNDNCNVVTDARVDIWHCNKDGYYSGYANQPGLLGSKSYVGETWLRGYQLSDSSGVVKFTTIYPGWYGGRATHIHMEIFISGVLKKIGQVAFSETISDAVQVSTLYAAHGVNPVRNASDSVFGNSATDLANETLALVGSIAAGYAGTYTIGLAL
ncbi:MAG: intradiol ring-cleavage dioxygenase [Mucilaginibacter sp.]|nr:intradiol ring-cleavage dioxygenase [Mucilaginibacter sp.]